MRAAAFRQGCAPERPCTTIRDCIAPCREAWRAEHRRGPGRIAGRGRTEYLLRWQHPGRNAGVTLRAAVGGPSRILGADSIQIGGLGEQT
jgi:hypothetical protein